MEKRKLTLKQRERRAARLFRLACDLGELSRLESDHGTAMALARAADVLREAGGHYENK